MKWRLCFFLPCMLLLSGCTLFSPKRLIEPEPARPVRLDQAKAQIVIREIEKSRREDEEWLRSSSMSYLAAINRVEFGQKHTLTVGRATDNDVVLSAINIELHHLKVSVDGDRFVIQTIDAGAEFKIKDAVKHEAVVDPSAIQVGRFRLRLSHQRFPAIIVFDPQSPRFREYKGIWYFPIDLSYRYELPLIHNPKPEKIVIQSTRGNRRTAERIGWVDFLVGDTPCRLEATHLLEPGIREGEVSIFFRDATSGNETYAVGRYVDLTKLENGNYLLDFNLAYNPACAFSNYYNCPIPPKSNMLKAAIRAGEKDSHYHSRSDEEHSRPLNGSNRWAEWLMPPSIRCASFLTTKVIRNASLDRNMLE
jgi:uncharacterized protein (DUF1684 family)